MAWGSSAAQRDDVRLLDRAAQALRLGVGRIDGNPQSWLRFAALVHLTLLVATIPLGPEIAIGAVSLGSAIVLIVLHRATAAAPTTDCLPLATVETHCGTEAAPTPPGIGRPADPALSEIMGQISHELRTPLNAIIGFSDLMGRELYGPVGDPRYQEYVSHIRDSGRSLLKSAEDTLVLTELLANRGDRAMSGPVDLEDLLVSSIARARSGGAGDCVHFDRHQARGLGIQGERRALHQVLLNVVAEALERAGTETITVSVSEFGPRAVVEIVAPSVTSASGAATLRLALARMMLELNGGCLREGVEATDTSPVWRATVCLDVARQPDLFLV